MSAPSSWSAQLLEHGAISTELLDLLECDRATDEAYAEHTASTRAFVKTYD
jgi:hypothetical protein